MTSVKKQQVGKVVLSKKCCVSETPMLNISANICIFNCEILETDLYNHDKVVS